jgi:hypothetical protein
MGNGRHGSKRGGKASQGGLGLPGDQGSQGLPEKRGCWKSLRPPKLGRSDRFNRGVPLGCSVH